MRILLLALLAVPAAAQRTIVPKAKPVVLSPRSAVAPRALVGASARSFVPSPLAASAHAAAPPLASPASALAPASEIAPASMPEGSVPASILERLADPGSDRPTEARRIFDGSRPMLTPPAELWVVEGRKYESTARLLKELPAAKGAAIQASYRYAHVKEAPPIGTSRDGGVLGAIAGAAVPAGLIADLFAGGAATASWLFIAAFLPAMGWFMGKLVWSAHYSDPRTLESRFPDLVVSGRILRDEKGGFWFDAPRHDSLAPSLVSLDRYAEAPAHPEAVDGGAPSVFSRDRGLAYGALLGAAALVWSPALPGAAALLAGSTFRVTDKATRVVLGATAGLLSIGALVAFGWPLGSLLTAMIPVAAGVAGFGYLMVSQLRAGEAYVRLYRARNPKGQWWSRPW